MSAHKNPDSRLWRVRVMACREGGSSGWLWHCGGCGRSLRCTSWGGALSSARLHTRSLPHVLSRFGAALVASPVREDFALRA